MPASADQMMPASAEPAPRLLLFLHTPKTGGSTVREWLLRNAGIRAPPQAATRLSAVVRYYEVRCFFCMQFARLWPAAVCDLALRRHCQSWTPRRRSFDSVRGDWRNASVAVELHAQSMDFYLATVAPRLPRLRALYARTNGVLTTATLVREPVDFLISFFNYFHEFHSYFRGKTFADYVDVPGHQLWAAKPHVTAVPQHLRGGLRPVPAARPVDRRVHRGVRRPEHPRHGHPAPLPHRGGREQTQLSDAVKKEELGRERRGPEGALEADTPSCV